jgi:hypothetical protein
MFVPKLEAHVGDFYNSSSGAGEVAPTGYPYAFFVRPVAGIKEDGFPVVFEVRRCPVSGPGTGPQELCRY